MITTRGLTKRYGAVTALDDLTLDVGPGEVFGFIGPNGAGKSTTMRILAALTRPDAGAASVAGLDVLSRADDVRRVLGYMPDLLGMYDDLTVDEYLQFFAAAFGIARASRRRVVDGVLELTDLTEKHDAMVDSLSRGMQQRLGVARVLVHDPKVLLLDEPASGLDPRARIEMRTLLVELGRMGKTVMVSSHILSELAEMCTSIGIIERGRLLYAGSIADAYARTRSMTGVERVLVRLERGSAPRERVIEAISRLAFVRRAWPEDDDGTLGLEFVPVAEGTDADPGTDASRVGVGHHDLIQALIGAGARIAAFQPQEIRLEDAFLKLTTGALQ